MKPLYAVSEIRAMEEDGAAGLPPGTLMQRAGRAAANAALEMLAGEHVLVLAGPGNNGGDALEVAANLAEANVDVSVLHLGSVGTASFETARALKRAKDSTARFVTDLPAAPGLIVDGLFGIGLGRPLDGRARTLVEQINTMHFPVLALDVPSGLDADTGAVVGPQGVAIRAARTITFLGDKPGLHTGYGRDYAGEVDVDGLGVAGHVPASAWLNEPALFARYLKPRRHASHKGSFGDVAIVGGAHGMAGAPMLSCRGALYAGAGRVYLAAVDPGPAYDSAQPEIMFRDAGGYQMAGSTLVVGPGMGDSAAAIRLLVKALDADGPLLLDADALNLVAASVDLQERLRSRQAVLTPHPLEAARLLGVTVAVVQDDRLAAARELAARFQATVVLKGSGSIIASADGTAVINPTGNPGLATAGTGDVLSGICGALMAQGWPCREAALAGVWLHGAAADRLVAAGIGPIGLTAGELPQAVRAVLNELIRDGQRRS